MIYIFNVVPLALHVLFPLVLQNLNLMGKKSLTVDILRLEGYIYALTLILPAFKCRCTLI